MCHCRTSQSFVGPNYAFNHHLIVVPMMQYPYCNSNPKGYFVATLALGSRPRQKGLQGCRPKGSLGVTSETPGSEGECEGVNHHTPKATPTLGDGVPVDSENFRERFEGSNLNGLWRSLYHWKALKT
jgi:hypothetical protein